jgi:hypothetical protein
MRSVACLLNAMLDRRESSKLNRMDSSTELEPPR